MRRIHVLKSASSAILIGLSPLFGQGVTLVGSGYSNPTAIRVSPGQITTIFVSGLTTDPTKPPNATSLPLPTSLAGISVSINQSSPSQSFPVPLLAVEQLNACSNALTPPTPTVSPDCMVGAITLQIPYELSPVPAPDSAIGTAFAELVVSGNSIASKAFPVVVSADNLHVLNTCDAFPSKQNGSQTLVIGACTSIVTHADGTLVTADSPALPGETVVIYAYGLGQTTPMPKAGQSSPTPAATLSSPLYLRFDFTSNAMPSPPFINRASAIAAPAPIFAGLTPGQVGLYQINVTIPSTIPAVEKCGSTCSHVACTMYNTVTSNLTIDIGANLSWDGAAICVQPPQ
jgi:hypothetical protein